MAIKQRALEETLSDVIDRLDEIYCDNRNSEDELDSCRERLWSLLQDIKLASSGEDGRDG
jgi:hypothetical protein